MPHPPSHAGSRGPRMGDVATFDYRVLTCSHVAAYGGENL